MKTVLTFNSEDVDKLPMRIRQIRSFATDCGVGIVE